MNRLWLGLGFVLVLIAVGAYVLQREAPLQPRVRGEPPSPVAGPPAMAPAEPAIKHPVEVPAEAAELPPFERAEEFVQGRIAELLGAKALKSYVRVDDFVRRAVATVDNLSRPFAPPRIWPLHPSPGRFTVEASAGGTIIAAKNASRYAWFVELVESVDSARAAALYRRLYPLFQRAYEALGYPGKHFNDRLVAVIDLLLVTPEPSGPLKVELPEIQGAPKPVRPWVLYRFADPTLEKLSSGQKILLRMGAENEKRLKAKLSEVRKLIAVGKAAR